MRTLLVVLGLPDWGHRMGLPVWEGASRAEDREWGALLSVAIDGGASLTPRGHEGAGHQPADWSEGGRED